MMYKQYFDNYVAMVVFILKMKKCEILSRIHDQRV